jgi:hypothetical protein
MKTPSINIKSSIGASGTKNMKLVGKGQMYESNPEEWHSMLDIKKVGRF